VTRIGIATTLAVLAGGLGAIALIGYYGFEAVSAQVLAVGWWRILLIAVIQAGVLALAGVAWWVLMIRPAHSLWPVVGARLIREAGSELLPFSAIGGYAMGARALMAQGAWGNAALASLIVDVTLEIAAQIVFSVIALGLLAGVDHHATAIGPLALGLVATAAVTALAYAAQHRNVGAIRRVVEPVVGKLLGGGLARTEAIQRHLNAIYRDARRPIAGFSVHLVCWIASALEIWLALKFMGVSIDIGSVIALEGLISAVSGAAFLVPSAIGVQEGAYVLLGAAFGLGPETALSLSVLKRARDLIVGLPSLLLWQGIEARQFWARHAHWFGGTKGAEAAVGVADDAP
jgi:glycosyltransferase 2 family protein